MSVVTFGSVPVSTEAKNPQHPTDWLLQLPDAALHCVLQQLDPCSLACTAVTCSRLRHAVPASISQLSVRLGKESGAVGLVSFALWFSRHCTVVTSLTHLSMDFGLRGNSTTVPCMPCPQLQHLQLSGRPVQLQPSQSCPGVLRYCSGLTALTLQECEIQDGQAAFAAVAALPELQHLAIEVPYNKEYLFLLPALQQLSKLTYLSLDYWSTYQAVGQAELWQELSEKMEQQSPFSGLVNLQQLRWISPSQGVPFDGLPGGLPSQLVKLTCLDVNYDCVAPAKSQLQQLSSMTSLQDLRIDIYSSWETFDFPGVEQLSQLTSLGIKCSAFNISAATTSRWVSRLTALERLSLTYCDVQPAAIAALTQLRALRLAFDESFAAGHDLLVELSKLQLLTELHVQLKYSPDVNTGAQAEGEGEESLPPAAGFIASTNLCCLQLGFQDQWEALLLNWALFTPGTMYPHLRCIDLAYNDDDDPYGLSWIGLVPVSEQQLQQLCSCCPAVESLAFMALEDPSQTAFLPLLQLSALTQLGIHRIPQLADPALLPLTSLTALNKLQLSTLDNTVDGYHRPDATLSLCNKACWFNPPDVWLQLLRHLLCDAACRQALLSRSPAGAAAPLELMLAQLAATLAEELAVALSG